MKVYGLVSFLPTIGTLYPFCKGKKSTIGLGIVGFK
jgi:hypothetical protein